MKQTPAQNIIRIIGVALLLPAMSSFTAEDSSSKKPNLLIIQTDEHNFRTLGCYRDTLPPEQAFMWGEKAVVETPHLDWIAENGAICTKFYATSPVCSPSRASFVSGQYPQNTLVVANNMSLSDEVITFAEILRRTGYATGYAGKWHLNGSGKPEWAPKRNFGFEDNRFMFNRGHWKQFEDSPEGPRVKARKGNKGSYSVAGADETSFSTDWLVDKAVDFIQSHKDQPFCYMLSLPDPHDPDTVRPPYDTAYNGMTFKEPRTYNTSPETTPNWAKPDQGGYDQSSYYGMVKCIDDHVGKILDCLRETNLLGNTMIIFTSDHGDLRGEHHRHNKGVPLEGSAKIPFMIHYPEKIAAGTRVTQALGTVDFLPTILGLMQVATTGKTEGRDASALFAEEASPKDWEDITFLRSAGAGNGKMSWIAAVTGRYKLVLAPNDPPWLIDMQEDPDEMKNFCTDPAYRETTRTLAGKLLAYGKTYNDERIAIPEIAEALRQLAEGI